MTEGLVDPIIKAFEILSDRISDLQDAVDLVRKTQVQTESLRYGNVSACAFGFPESCSLTRRKEELPKRYPNNQPCELFLNCVVVEIYFRCSPWDRNNCCSGICQMDKWADELPETQDYYTEMQKRCHPVDADGSQNLLTTKEADVISVHELLVDEAYERQLHSALPSGWCLHLLDESDTSFSVALFPTPRRGGGPQEEQLPFATFVHLVKILCKVKHPQQSCWKSVTIDEVNRNAVQLDRVAKLIEIYGKTPERVQTAKTLIRNLPDNYMSNNVNFYHWKEMEADFIASLE